MRRSRAENLNSYCKQYISQALTLDSLRLHYAFELECDTETELPTSSNGIVLIYCVSGEGQVVLQNQSVTLDSGHVVVSPAQEMMVAECTDPSKPFRLAGVVFSILNVSAAHQTPLLMFYDSLRIPVTSASSPMLNDLFSNLYGELMLVQHSPQLVNGFVNQILVSVYRSLASHELSVDEEEPNINAVGHTVYAIIRYVDEHLFSMNNLMDMAKELGYSYNYLSHLFRRKTGMTIQSYVSRKKIEKSIELLSDERLSVTEIASVLNYDCIQSFSKAFRRAMNMSPTEYRMAHGLDSNE